MKPIFSEALYVKQDIYRIMILTLVYFGFFSFLQIQNFGYFMIITFLLSLPPFLIAVSKIKVN